MERTEKIVAASGIIFSSVAQILKEVRSVETGVNRIFTTKNAHTFGQITMLEILMNDIDYQRAYSIFIDFRNKVAQEKRKILIKVHRIRSLRSSYIKLNSMAFSPQVNYIRFSEK
jgi:hypothetical protein